MKNYSLLAAASMALAAAAAAEHPGLQLGPASVGHCHPADRRTGSCRASRPMALKRRNQQRNRALCKRRGR